jgi:hypothetical protein
MGGSGACRKAKRGLFALKLAPRRGHEGHADSGRCPATTLRV